MEEKLNDAHEYIRKMYSGFPKVGIVLGTGLGGLVNEIEIQKEIPYNFIPHFPISTVESHFGKLIFGQMSGKPVVAMQGRFHLYEGYDMGQITFPIRIMKMLGVETLFISNAAGTVNQAFKKGSLMLIEDHINLQGTSPLVGPNLVDLGPRFPDMSQPYDAELMVKAKAIAVEEKITMHKGVYVALVGPNLETRAEYRYLRIIGADLVGMSTVPEVIVANHMGIKVLAISVITDDCDPDFLKPVDISEIIQVAKNAEPNLTRIFSRLIREF